MVYIEHIKYGRQLLMPVENDDEPWDSGDMPARFCECSAVESAFSKPAAGARGTCRLLGAAERNAERNKETR
jgi:hypothetical protein